MSQFVPVPDVAEFAVVQRLQGNNVINIYHLKKEGGWDSATLADACVTLITGYNDHIAPNQSHDLQYVIVRARDISVADGAIAEINFPPNSGGDDLTQSMPGNVALAIKHTTGFAGRSRRGRTFLSGIPRAVVGVNDVTTGYRDDVVNSFDALDSLFTNDGYTWGIVSKYSGYTQSPPKYKKVPTPRVVGLFTDINNNSADVDLDSMRSRLNGRGS